MPALSCCHYEEPSESETKHMNRCFHFEIKGVIVANPVVFGTSLIVLWVFVAICCAFPDHMGKGMSLVAFSWIPEVWTWLYIISQNIWVCVLLWAAVFYGHVKLGKDEDKPDFSTATWFSMLFCAGLATGLFYYAVAEPVWHYTGSGRFTKKGREYGTLDEDATQALELTIYHWGVHGWIPYVVMGAIMGIMTYRRGFPLTVRYAFWPVIGEGCYGIIGDFIDTLSIVTSISGVCTSLGLGAMQINAGMTRLSHGFYRGINYAIPDEPKFSNPMCGSTGELCKDGEEAFGIQSTVGNQVLIIVVITCIATISVVLGLKVGIKLLSQVVFAMGMGLTLFVMFSGETWYCLDSMVQGFGYYVWDIVRLGNWCDAWNRLGDPSLGLGGVPSKVSRGFISGWTLFYWGWWISWGPFVGTFLAKISKGRTVREFVAATLIVPTLFTVLWFGTWGSEGIRMQRMASESNVCSLASNFKSSDCSMPSGATGRVSPKCLSYSGSFSNEFKKKHSIGWEPTCVLDPHYHGGFGKCKEFAWTRYKLVGKKCVKTTSWVTVPCGNTTADPTAPPDMSIKPYLDSACSEHIHEAQWNSADKSKRHFNHFPKNERTECFVPAQDSLVCLANQGTTDILFDQLATYGPRGFSDLLCVVALCCLTLYFVTSSDSGSLVVDILSSNGHPEPPVFQRIFWSATEGATAIALLLAGQNAANSDASLKALQSASIICGLPYTFILFYATLALALALREEAGTLDPDRKAFDVFIFNFKLWKNHILNIFAPGISLGKAVSECGKWPGAETFSKQNTRILWTVLFSAMYYLCILFLILGAVTPNWAVVGGVIFCGFAVLTGLVRNDVRRRFNIQHGDLFMDLICGLMAHEFTLSQIDNQFEHDPGPSKKLDSKAETCKEENPQMMRAL